jgi:biotin carboxyl carrier protein
MSISSKTKLNLKIKQKEKKTVLNNDFLSLKYARLKVEDFKDRFSILKQKLNFKKILLFIQRKPFTSFFVVLGVLFILMVVGNLLFSPKPTPQQNLNTLKKVQVYKLGSAPQVSYQGRIEKSGVVKVVAQMPGIVSNITVSEGQQVWQGTNILSLSTNYQGGNALSISRQIAQVQYNNAKDSYGEQKDLIGRQRDLTNANKDNADQLRIIASQSANDSQNLVNYDQSIVDTLNQSLQDPTLVDKDILSIKAQIAQFQSIIVQLNSTIKNLQLQGDQTKAPTNMAAAQQDIALKQLDLQQKALDMSLEISRLSYNLALVSEANMYPSSPFAGVVDKIYVHVGESISGGDILASISGSNQHVKIVVSVPENIAKNLSRIEPSTLQIGNDTISMIPSYVSQDATSGTLYSIIFDLDDSLSSKLTDATYVNVNLPIGTGDTSNIDPFIPLDSVIQTQEEAFVYIVDKKMTARVKKVSLGQIQGKYVEVLSGLPAETQVILNRNIIEGDRVQITR